MNKPIVLKAKEQTDYKLYPKRYQTYERRAIKRAGFELVEVKSGIFGGIEPEHDVNLQGRAVMPRHHADQNFGPYIERLGGKLLVPEYTKANTWYLHDLGDEFMCRKLRVIELHPYKLWDDDNANGLRDLLKDLRAAFDELAVNGRCFVKSATKKNLRSKVYTWHELSEDLPFWTSLVCHNRPHTYILSSPLKLVRNYTFARRVEYRCLVVNRKVVDCSLFTEHLKLRDYRDVVQFAQAFADRNAEVLPHSYDVDVARLADGSLAVVELNDICACGFFADNNLDVLFGELYKLATS